jgi:hypothetical protein
LCKFRAGSRSGFLFAIAAIVGALTVAKAGAADTPTSGPQINSIGAANALCTAGCDLQKCDWQHDTRVCSRNRDTRSCDRCLVSAFGRCIQRGNDPACEVSKASQNAAYDAAAASCEAEKATQNAVYDALHAACEASAAKQKLSCEVAKAACQARGQIESRP